MGWDLIPFAYFPMHSCSDAILRLAPALTVDEAAALSSSLLAAELLDHPTIQEDLFLGNFTSRLHPYRLADPRLSVRAVKLCGEWLVCHFCPQEIVVSIQENQSWPAGECHLLADRETILLGKHRLNRESLEMVADWRDDMPIVRSIDAEANSVRLSTICKPEHQALLRYDQGFSLAPLPGRVIRVNGVEIGQTQPVFPSDHVEIGHFRGQAFDLIGHIRARNDVLSLENVTKRFPDGTLGLQDLTFSLQSGDFVAVMGPSGSGKSTFLDVITGSLATQGKVNVADFGGRIAVVPQDDVLFETLSVEENLRHAARLRTKMAEAEISRKIDEVLPLIGLAEKRALRAGSDLDRTLSGGQRRRLSIGLELMGNPSLLILDEPTSGLSGPDAASVVELLRSLSRRGALVIATIHQPSPETFARFDKLIVLDRGGVLAYFGYAAEAAEYFAGPGAFGAEPVLGTLMKSTRPPRGMAEVRLHEPDHWGKLYAENRTRLYPPLILADDESPSASHAAPRSWISKLERVTRREFARRLKDWRVFLQSFILAGLLGALIAIVCRQGLPYQYAGNKIVASYAFLAVILSQFLAASAAVGELVKDRRKQQREKLLEIDGGIYVLSKLPFLFLLNLIQAGIIAWAGYQILSIPFGFYPFWGILSLAGCAASSLGLLVSALPRMTEMKAMSAVPLLLIPQIVLAGADPFSFADMKHLQWPFKTTEHTQAPWFTAPVPSRWAYEGAIHAWTDIPGQTELEEAKSDRATLNFFKKYRPLFLKDRAQFDARYQEKFGRPFDYAQMTRNIALMTRFGILQQNDVSKTYLLDYRKLAPHGADLQSGQHRTLQQHADSVVTKERRIFGHAVGAFSFTSGVLSLITLAATLLAVFMNRLSLGQGWWFRPHRDTVQRVAAGHKKSSTSSQDKPVVVVTPATHKLLIRHLDPAKFPVQLSTDILSPALLAYVEEGAVHSAARELRTFQLGKLLARIVARKIALPLDRGNASEPLVFTLFTEPEWEADLRDQIEQIGQSLKQGTAWQSLPPIIHVHHSSAGEIFGTAVYLRKDRPEFTEVVEEMFVHEFSPDSPYEQLARQIHIEYSRVEAADRRDENHSPAVGQAWETLDETYRGYSRDSATHLLASVQGLGYRISANKPAVPSDGTLMKQLAAHLEELAACEHYRWMAARVLKGWSYGNPRDDARKLHPDILPYQDLSESTREKDRACVRALAVTLQRGIMHAS